LGYELAQPVFALYDAAGADAAALARYRTARDALRLQLADSSGVLVPVRDVNIRRDQSARADGTGLLIEVGIDDQLFWAQAGQL
jgi:hypothetical protein